MVLSFLKNFRDAANNDGISEGSTPRILPYFLQGSAAADLQSQLAEWETDTAISLWPRLVAWLLEEFATTPVLRTAYNEVTSCKQGERESAREFGNRIKTAALRAGSVFTDKALANVFMDGLLPRVAAMVNSVRKPDMTMSHLQNLGTDMGGAVGS